MPVFGLRCSHEQVHPHALLAAVQQAKAVEFDAATASDHFSPWSSRQGHSAPPLLVGAAVSEARAAWCADLGAHTTQLAEYTELGFDKIFLHHVGQEQEAFVDAFGQKVLPQLRSAA